MRGLFVAVLAAVSATKLLLAASAPADNGTIHVLLASYGAGVNPSLSGDATASVEAWCGGKAACTYTVCVCGYPESVCTASDPPCAPDPAPNSAKDFVVWWACTGDVPGHNRSCYLPEEAANEAVELGCTVRL